MKLLICVLLNLVILPKVFTDTIVGLRHVLDKEDHEKLKEFVDKVVNSTFEDLAMPPILQPSTSPAKFLQEESSGSTHQVCLIRLSRQGLNLPTKLLKKELLKFWAIFLSSLRSFYYIFFGWPPQAASMERSHSCRVTQTILLP